MKFLSDNKHFNRAASPAGTAVSADGTGTTNTTTVVNSVTGETELRMQFHMAAGKPAASIPLKIGAHEDPHAIVAAIISDATGITFSCPEFGDSLEEMLRYFKYVRTMWAGLRMETDNTVNFDGYLNITEKAPDGTEKNVKKYINKYKAPLGGGTFGNSLIIPSKDLKLGIWPGLKVDYANLQPNSTLTIYAPLRGWNKPSTLSALRESNI